MVHPEYLVPLRNNRPWHRLRLHRRTVLETTLVYLLAPLVGKTGVRRLPLVDISPLHETPVHRISSLASPLPAMNRTSLPAIEPK